MKIDPFALLQKTRVWFDSPAKRYSAWLIGLAALGIGHVINNQEPHRVAPVPSPIIQGEQLRFPAGHPHLALLSTATAVEAERVNIELPARLVWNEERTQRIYPAFAGRVVRLDADVGQVVKAGQALATLASPEFGVAQADTAKAQADARLFDRALARQQELFEAGIVSRKELDQAEADATRAQAEFARAQARTRMYGGTHDVNQQLILAATIPGVVVERNLGAGQEVRPDQGSPASAALFVVTDPSSLWVQIDAREADIGSLKPATAITLSFPNLPEQRFDAKIAATGDYIDSNTRSIKVRALLDNKQRQLKAEMLGTAHIERHVGAGVLVPASAVQLRGKAHWAYVQTEPGVFEPREVKLGYEGPEQVHILQGVKPGEQVVKDNALLLARAFRVYQEEAGKEATKP